MKIFLLLTSVLVGLTGVRALGEDLDVARARATYEREHAEAETARRNLAIAEQQLEPLVRALRQAKADLVAADQSLANQRQRLVDVDQQIQFLERTISDLQTEIDRYRIDLGLRQSELQSGRQNLRQLQQRTERLAEQVERLREQVRRLESQPGTGNWTCIFVDRGHEEHGNRHRATHADRSVAMQEAEAACLAVHGSCKLRSCTQPESQQLVEARRRLQERETEYQEVFRDYEAQQNWVVRAESDIAALQRVIQEREQQKRNREIDLAAAWRHRDNILLDIRAAETRRGDAAFQLQRAEDAVIRQQPYVDEARRVAAIESEQEQKAYNYYQTVLANYERARQRVISQAQSAGSRDSDREAGDRAPAAGSAHGSKDGQAAGLQKGKADGAVLAFAQGYRAGRTSPSSTPALAAVWRDGVTRGEAMANDKARSENMPEGYNAAAREALNAIPDQQETLDISVEVPPAQGGNGPDMAGSQRQPQVVAAPSYPIPGDPVVAIPGTPAAQFNTPSVERRYFSYPCDQLPLVEFLQECKKTYEGAYDQGFRDHYRRQYVSAFNREFASSAKSAYEQARAGSYPADLERGQKQGAFDAGVLTGFEQRLVAARSEAVAQGRKEFAELLAKGHLLIVRSAKLVETSGDGVLITGEKAALEVVIDNVGGTASPKGGLKLVVESLTGGSELSFQVRELPSLAGGTRTTLRGVVTATNTGKLAGALLKLRGRIERNGQSVGTLAPEIATHFPVELVDIALQGEAQVNKPVNAKLKYVNLSNTVQTDISMKLTSSPALVEVATNPLALGTLEPGQAVEVDVQLKPGVWVGANNAVNFLSQDLDAEGAAKSVQNFEKIISVTRNASIEVYDANGRAIPASGLNVTAGGLFTLQAQFRYHATRALPGPFVMKFANGSDAGLRVENSTSSVNYGSWGPSYRAPDRVVMRIRVPASLKGKSAWVMLQLNEGVGVLHAPYVQLNVQ